jgi:hypothetical protein
MAKQVKSPHVPPRSHKGESDLDNVKDEQLTALNFKVPDAFHREFKAYAAMRGVSMLELLQEGFRLTKERGDE